MVSSPLENPRSNGTSLTPPMPRLVVNAKLGYAPREAMRKEGVFLSWLLNASPMLFFVAVSISIALYVRDPFGSDRLAPVFGIAIAVLLGLLFYGGWMLKSTPPCSNPRQYGKLAHWCTVLDSHLSTWCDEPVTSASAGIDPRSAERACRGAIMHRNFVATSLALSESPSTSQVVSLVRSGAATSSEAQPQQEGNRQHDLQAQESRERESSTGRRGGQTSKRIRGQRWLTGAGYVELWERLHRAEEDMFLVLPPEEIVAAGQYDELRLTGSTIANRQGLLYRLSIALEKLGGSAYLTTEPQARPEGSALLRGRMARTDSCPANDEVIAARYALREIRFAINEYRDAQRDGLVRVRSNLCWTGTLTALVAFALFGLAMAFEAPITSIYGATAIYLVGAVVGLFNSLSISADDDGAETEEDYGLTQARLLNSPMLSGLAAVGGVLLAYIGIGALGDASAGSGDAADFPKLWEIFDIESNPEAVVIAALFGLTPRLLIKRLQTEGDRFRQGLQRSSAPTGRHANGIGRGD